METTEVTFYCTDKGRHPRREIGPIEDDRASLPMLAKVLDGFGFDGTDATATEPTLKPKKIRNRTTAAGEHVTSKFDSLRVVESKGGNVWHFECPTCGRTPRVKEAQILQVLEMALNGHESALDVSNYQR